jgi:sulfofructose kinase
MTRVICLGGLVLDHVFQVDRLPLDPVKVMSTRHEARGGGMAATAAVALAALGADASFWGRAGDDADGRAVSGQLAATGVDVGDLRFFAGGATAVSAVLIDAEGDRALVAFPGGGLDAGADWLPLAKVSAADAVLCDPRWPAGATALLAEARKHGVPSVLDADVTADGSLGDLVALPDHALFSETALMRFTGEGKVAKALEVASAKTKAQVGVTLGARGCCLWAGAPVFVPSHEVVVRDTNGAGDTFHGAYALAVAEGRAAIEAAEFANAAAALKCTLGHGWRSMPRRQEVEALIRKRT